MSTHSSSKVASRPRSQQDEGYTPLVFDAESFEPNHDNEIVPNDEYDVEELRRSRISSGQARGIQSVESTQTPNSLETLVQQYTVLVLFAPVVACYGMLLGVLAILDTLSVEARNQSDLSFGLSSSVISLCLFGSIAFLTLALKQHNSLVLALSAYTLFVTALCGLCAAVLVPLLYTQGRRQVQVLQHDYRRVEQFDSVHTPFTERDSDTQRLLIELTYAVGTPGGTDVCPLVAERGKPSSVWMVSPLCQQQHVSHAVVKIDFNTDELPLSEEQVQQAIQQHKYPHTEHVLNVRDGSTIYVEWRESERNALVYLVLLLCQPLLLFASLVGVIRARPSFLRFLGPS
ncbi:MAG: hypothetical protein MHM6MM_000525 [Cercozoa sp. M6MM]